METSVSCLHQNDVLKIQYKSIMKIFSSVFFMPIVFFSCAEYPAIREKKVFPSDHANNLQKVKKLVINECGSCHAAGLKTSKAAALKVFNLDDSDWMKNMNDVQLKKTFIQRLGFSVPEKDRITVTDCLGEELYLRKTKIGTKDIF